MQGVHHRVGGNGGGRQCRNKTGHQQLADIKRSAFQPAGDADMQDAPEHGFPEAQVGRGTQPHRAVGAQQPPDHNDRPQHPGGQRCQPRTQYLQPEAVDEHGVADEIEDIGGGGNGHGELGIAHRPEHRGTDIIQRQKGIAENGDGEIGACVVHHLRLDLPEKQHQELIPQQEEQQRNDQRKAHQQQGKLPHAAPGVFLLSVADVLRQHHTAAGGQRREQPQEYRIDRIDERHPGNGGLAAGGHHHGIGHADGHGKRLLDHQRHQQPPQVLPTEHSLQSSLPLFHKKSRAPIVPRRCGKCKWGKCIHPPGGSGGGRRAHCSGEGCP